VVGAFGWEACRSTIAARKQRKNRIDIVLGQIPVAVQQNGQFIQDAGDGVDVLVFSLQVYLISTRGDLCGGECGFDPFQVDVVEAEEEEGFGLIDLKSFFFQIRCS